MVQRMLYLFEINCPLNTDVHKSCPPVQSKALQSAADRLVEESQIELFSFNVFFLLL